MNGEIIGPVLLIAMVVLVLAVIGRVTRRKGLLKLVPSDEDMVREELEKRELALRQFINRMERARGESVVSAIRWNDAALCQFGRCDELNVDGTAYCAPHLETMRLRRMAELDEEQPSVFEFCAVDIESGQADGYAGKEAA